MLANAKNKIDFYYVCFVKFNKNNYFYKFDNNRKNSKNRKFLKLNNNVFFENKRKTIKKFIQRKHN